MAGKVTLHIYWSDGATIELRYFPTDDRAKKLARKYQYDKIDIYYINYSQSFNSSDFVQGKFDKDLAHEIRK